MCRITTISDYLERIKEINILLRNDNVEFERPIYYYRGEDECFPTIISSLYQLRNKCDYTIELVESKLIEEAKIRFPEIVSECTDNVEMLIKFQHYGLPTRLLDVTSNPLIALYFACKENGKETDGRVLICKNIITPYKEVQAIGTILGSYGFDTIHALAKKVKYDPVFANVDSEKIVFFLQQMIDKPLLFRAPQINPRIKVQQGAFVFTPLKTIILVQNDSVEVKDNESGGLNSAFHTEKTLIIDKKSKKTILDDLDIMGYNEATIFPEEEHKMHYIKDHYLRFSEYNWKLDL